MSDQIPNELKILAEKIAEFREKHRLTYQEMGEATGVDKSHIYRIENMAVYPSLKFLIRLAEYMDIPLYYLFLPSQNLSKQDCARQIQNGLRDMNLKLSQLEERSGIPLIRLMELEKGISTPNLEEWSTLQQLLNLSQEPRHLENKFKLLRALLSDLGVKDEQIENLMNYIQHYMD